MIRAKKITIRSKKEDSAFLYHIFEAQEGLTAYSTLPFTPHDQIRDVELIFSAEALTEVRELLQDLGTILTVIDDKN